MKLLRAWRALREQHTLRHRPIPDALWRQVRDTLPFIAHRPACQQARLRELATLFLADKQFHGVHGLAVTDAMALSVALQACLPVLRLGLDWYDDFVGIVLHPGEMLARREWLDDDGVVHHYDEVLAGEAMEGGPVTLSWPDVAAAGATAAQGYNLVIHEFVHKLDMRDGAADGCPPLPSRAERNRWLGVLQTAYEQFCNEAAEARFMGQTPWLDPYAAESTGEFFAVTAEAHFVAPEDFAQRYPALHALYLGFFGDSAQ